MMVDTFLHRFDRCDTTQKLVSRILSGPQLRVSRYNTFALKMLHQKFTFALEMSKKIDCQLTLAVHKSNLASKRMAVGLLKGSLVVVYGLGPKSHVIASSTDVMDVEERVMGGLYFLSRYMLRKCTSNGNVVAQFLNCVLDANVPASLSPSFKEVAKQCVDNLVFFKDVSHLLTTNFTQRDQSNQRYTLSPQCLCTLTDAMLKTDSNGIAKMKNAAAYAMTKLILARNNVEHDLIIYFLPPYSEENFEDSGHDLDVYCCRDGLGDTTMLLHLRENDKPMPTNTELAEVLTRKRTCNLFYNLSENALAKDIDRRVVVINEIAVFNLSLINNLARKVLKSLD